MKASEQQQLSKCQRQYDNMEPPEYPEECDHLFIYIDDELGRFTDAFCIICEHEERTYI